MNTKTIIGFVFSENYAATKGTRSASFFAK